MLRVDLEDEETGNSMRGITNVSEQRETAPQGFDPNITLKGEEMGINPEEEEEVEVEDNTGIDFVSVIITL